jgi:hypothetical protein
MLWCFTSRGLLYCVGRIVEFLTNVFFVFQPISVISRETRETNPFRSSYCQCLYLMCRLVFNTMAKIYPLSVTSYPDELKVPLLLHQFPSPAGHPPPLNTPSRWGGMDRQKVF